MIYVARVKALTAYGVDLQITPDRISIATIGDAYNGIETAFDGEEVHEEFKGLSLMKNEPFVLTLEDFRNKQEWKDSSIWTFTQKYETRRVSGVINKLAETFSMRASPGSRSLFTNQVYALDIVVPDTECTFTDMAYFLFVPEHCKIETNLPYEEIGQDEAEALRYSVLPTLTITGPTTIAAGATESLEINALQNSQAYEYPLDVELEHVNGYLPKTRVRTRGTGTFKVSALGLDPGDFIKVKAGFRYRASVAEHILEVV